jgi:beta-RFAP synthase
MTRRIHISAPSRLHFGMFSFGNPAVPQFGGVGTMIDAPRVELTIQAAAEFSSTGPLAERALEVARRVWGHLNQTGNSSLSPPACRVEVTAAPAEHAGLGVGTQLSLAITAGILKLIEHPPVSPAELAKLAGRGLRSAVGTYGFMEGGLLVEAGKLGDELLSPLSCRLALPTAWRFVLIFSDPEKTYVAGLSGERELAAFAQLPPVSEAVTNALCGEALLHLIPAGRTGEFERFSESLFRYGLLAGECFASCQGGPFASPGLARLIATLRRLGIRGVGQSSWGPTLFALVESEAAARALVEQLGQEPEARGKKYLITAPDAQGAQISILAEPAA